MTWTPTISTERREAIGRAGRAVVRLAVDPQAKDAAHRQNAIVNDVTAYTDREAWDAVQALEGMILARGLRESSPVLDPATLYIAYDRLVCGTVQCAGYRAVHTGQTIDGVPLDPFGRADLAAWHNATSLPPTCDCGAVTYPTHGSRS